MRTDQLARFLAPLAFVAVVSLVVGACSGGGGSGDGDGGDAVVVGINVQGINEPLHANGTDNPGGTTPVGAFLNARVTITFGAGVSPATIPGAGPAQSGSIQIVDAATNLPANGVFSVNPANPTQVFFDAFPPSGADPCQAGFVSGATYRISVNASGSGGPVVRVGGTALQSGANPVFGVRACGNPGDDPFTDTNNQPPSVVATSPAAGSTNPAASIPGFPNNSVITIDIDEALDPTSVTNASVQLVNRTINPNFDVPAGGTVSFIQFGIVPNNPTIARISFTSTLPLADGHDYDIRLNGVTDLAGNPLTLMPDQFRFTIEDAGNNVPQTFTDDFSSTANRLDLAAAIVWPGTVTGDPNSGRVAATFPEEIIGNGLDGVGNFTTTMTINSDNQVTASTVPGNPGTYNFTSLTIGNTGNPTFALSFQSTTDNPPGEVNWPVRLRSMTSVDILGGAVIRCNGRQNPLLGGQSITPATTVSINGGWGGPGAGRGGDSSPISDPNIDNDFGLPGEGAHVDPNLNNRPGGMLGNVANGFPSGTFDAFFGGGGAGESGFSITMPNFGAGGGGGGTASGFTGMQTGLLFSFQSSTSGETDVGNDGLGTGAPMSGPPGQPMAYMIPPLADACGGSGGGAGGDRRETPGDTFATRAGGAGSGGGGGLRVTAGGDITFGLLSIIECKGGEGGRVLPPRTGYGGGGSGGSQLFATFNNIVLPATMTFSCRGGAPGAFSPGSPTPALDSEGGQGGDGIVQLEDGSTSFLTTFMNQTVVEGEALGQALGFASNVDGTATSTLIDSGSNAVDYTSASATIMPGPTGTVTITLIGIAEDPNNAGQPAQTMTSANGDQLMVGPVPFAQIDELDGYRYFQFIIATEFPPPPATMQGDPLPFVDDITVDYVQ